MAGVPGAGGDFVHSPTARAGRHSDFSARRPPLLAVGADPHLAEVARLAGPERHPLEQLGRQPAPLLDAAADAHLRHDARDVEPAVLVAHAAEEAGPPAGQVELAVLQNA